MSKKKQWSVKHRPNTATDMVTGNNLENIEDLAHNSQALLISGGSGTGKTTLARIIAGMLNGYDDKYHLKEINAAEDRGIDVIREIKASIGFKPDKDKKWVVLFDEAHALTDQASSAMLKLLEDPPSENILFLICTDQPWKLKPTVQNRCRHVAIKPPEQKDLAKYLLRVMKREKVDVDKKVAKNIAISVTKWSNGVPRQALQILQDACSLLAKGKSWKEAKSVVAVDDDADVNSVVGSILLAIYSVDKSPDARAAHIIKSVSTTDVFGVINRISTANYFGMQLEVGGKFDWRSKQFTDPLKSKSITPTLRDMTLVQTIFNQIQENLKDIKVDPTLLIGTSIANIPYVLEMNKNSKKKEGK